MAVPGGGECTRENCGLCGVGWGDLERSARWRGRRDLGFSSVGQTKCCGIEGTHTRLALKNEASALAIFFLHNIHLLLVAIAHAEEIEV